MYFNQHPPHQYRKMLSLENLILAIEDLEAKGIISFDEFKELTYKEIRDNYFLMPNSTSLSKAIIKIEDKRSGRTGSSTLTVFKEKYINNKLVKEESITYKF